MSIEKKAAGVWHISPATGRPRRRNTPRLPPAQRREQLLDAALRVIGRDGLSGLTMQEVAKQAGVAKPVLYAMYPTAPELVGALLHREHARGMAQIFAAMPEITPGTDPDEQFVAAVMAYLEAVAASPERWRLILWPTEGASGEHREVLTTARDDLLARYTAMLRTGFRVRGGPADADVELIGHVMIGFTESLGRLVLSDPDRFPPARLRPTVRALLRTLPRD